VLLAAVAKDDRSAFAELYARHAPWLMLRLGRRCADRGMVEEVLQDTFVGVWRGARRWDGRGEVAAWMWGIAVRRLVDAVRRRPAAAVSLDELPEGVGASEPSAEDSVLSDVPYGDVGAALSRLPADLRAVMRATVIDGLTTKEAGRLLGIPAGTVKTRMMRARIMLREELA
jgi:RNA polymerase sigma-70 factor (ECF subfamily)